MTIDEVTNRDMAKWKAPSDKQVQEAFNAFDIDGSGDIDLYEIQVALAKYWGVQLTEKEALSVMTLYDGDGNGTLDIDEFRVMLANLEDLDPAAISRFWLSQVAAVPGARQVVEGVGSMKKIGDHLGNKLAKSAVGRRAKFLTRCFKGRSGVAATGDKYSDESKHGQQQQQQQRLGPLAGAHATKKKPAPQYYSLQVDLKDEGEKKDQLGMSSSRSSSKKKVDERSPPTSPTHDRYSDQRVNDTARWALEIQRHERERKLKKKERRQRREQEGRTVGEDDNVLALRRSSTGRF